MLWGSYRLSSIPKRFPQPAIPQLLAIELGCHCCLGNTCDHPRFRAIGNRSFRSDKAMMNYELLLGVPHCQAQQDSLASSAWENLGQIWSVSPSYLIAQCRADAKLRWIHGWTSLLILYNFLESGGLKYRKSTLIKPNFFFQAFFGGHEETAF